MNKKSENYKLDDNSQLDEISGGADELNGKVGSPEGIECRSMYAFTGVR